MLTIRLQRAGKANQPQFRIVVAEKSAAASKKFVEVLGHYNPRTKEFGVKPERVTYWISQQVSLSPTIHNLFITQKITEGTKVKAFTIPKKPVEPVVTEPVAAVAAEPEAAVPASAETPAEETPPVINEDTTPAVQPEPVEPVAEIQNP